MIRIVLAAAALTTLLPAAARAQDYPFMLMELDRAFARATAIKGIDGWVEFTADDAIFMPEGADIVRGKEAVRKFYAPMFARPGFALAWRPLEAFVAPSEDVGYTIGEWRSKGLDKTGKPYATQGKYKYLTIWKKQKDGSWKVAVDVGNSSPAAAAK
jgi:ketosteroid isomerase-like protein